MEVLDHATMQVFLQDFYTIIAVPIRCDVNGMPKGSHYDERTTDGIG